MMCFRRILLLIIGKTTVLCGALTDVLNSGQEAEDRQGAELALKQHRDATSKLQAEQDQETQVSKETHDRHAVSGVT